MAAPNSRLTPAMALFAARVVYAFNWYNVGAVGVLIEVSLHLDAAAFGLVLGAFLVGVGLFQIPAGLLDLVWGARRTALFGLAVMGGAALASAFSRDLLDLVVLRFLAGVGAAFFFSPALSLVASYFPPGQRGPIIGLYNGGFSLGGAIGLDAGALAGLRLGWPFALGVGGAGLLVAALVNFVLLPRGAEPREVRDIAGLAGAFWRVLSSRSIWALSLALTGFWGAVYIVAQYYVVYAHAVHAAWGVETAAVLTSIFVVMSLPGGPLGGWIGERGPDRRYLLVACGVIAGASVLAIPFLTLDLTVVDFVVLGLFDGVVFAILYLIPSYLPETEGHGVALGIAFVNSVQVSAGSLLAILFGVVAVATSFTVAWLLIGGLALALLPMLLWVTPNRAGQPVLRTGPGAGSSGWGPDPPLPP